MKITDDYDYAKGIWLIKCRGCEVSMTREAYASGHDCEVKKMKSIKAHQMILTQGSNGNKTYVVTDCNEIKFKITLCKQTNKACEAKK
jgi:hypothetical protein